MKLISLAVSGVFLLCIYYSCKSGNSPDDRSIATDSATIAAGEKAFIEKCSGCHNFRQDGIGPQLSGITRAVSPEWIEHFIQDPKKIIESGDERGQSLFKKYHTVMPSFASGNNDEIIAIIAFLHTHQETRIKETDDNDGALKNPIVRPIVISPLVAGLELITQFPASSDSGKLPLARITEMDFQPGKTQPFILDLRGKLYRLNNNYPEVYMDMARLQPKFINVPGLATGFGSFAFHPDFFKNGLLYTTHTEPAGTAQADFRFADTIKPALQWVITEWKTQNPNAFPFSGKGRELFRVDMVSNIHGVQQATFNPLSKHGDEDYGFLYIGIGDGGSVENGYGYLAHSPEKIWGTVVRINPGGSNSKNHQYGIPPGNPFVRDEKALKEIYAYGFRNPHRITWTQSGQMLVSNVGHGNIESVDLIYPGNDYGWPVREGTFAIHSTRALNSVYPLPADDSLFHIVYPVIQYDHDEGKAISGGYEYSGNAVPFLKGKFLFGDIPTGRLFYSDIADIKQGKQAMVKEWKLSVKNVPKTLKELCGSDRVDLHFGRDDKGEIYILTKADGRMYKLISATEK